jgi:cytochrome c-type protein NapB
MMFFVFPNVFNGGNDMKKILFSLSLLVLVFALTATVSAGEKYKSLRGGTNITGPSNAPETMDWEPEESPIARTFVHQPPLIPHPVEEYDMSISDNDCLDCHGDEDSGAPMPHDSHYTDRDGGATEGVSSRWYFCTQCHVGQVDVKPLVKNTFQAK